MYDDDVNEATPLNNNEMHFASASMETKEAYFQDKLSHPGDSNSNASSKRCCCPSLCGSVCICCHLNIGLQDYEDFAGTEQLEIIHDLIEKASVRFDPKNPAHEKDLFELWVSSLSSLPSEASLGSKIDKKTKISASDKRWSLLGFQGMEPRTDFRSAGLLGLKSLLFYVKEYRSTDALREILRRDAEEQTGWAYPFAATALSIYFMLINRLHLTENRSVAAKQVSVNDKEPVREREDLRCFCWLACEADDPTTALFEIFGGAMTIMDHHWIQLEKKVGKEKKKALSTGGEAAAFKVVPPLMRFNQEVLPKVWPSLQHILSHVRPSSFEDFRRAVAVEVGVVI
eukprot:g312.t1